MPRQVHGKLQRLKELDREIQLLKHTTALASWDQETYMPKGAIEGRAEQISLLEGWWAFDRSAQGLSIQRRG